MPKKRCECTHCGDCPCVANYGAQCGSCAHGTHHSTLADKLPIATMSPRPWQIGYLPRNLVSETDIYSTDSGRPVASTNVAFGYIGNEDARDANIRNAEGIVMIANVHDELVRLVSRAMPYLTTISRGDHLGYVKADAHLYEEMKTVIRDLGFDIDTLGKVITKKEPPGED